MSDDVEARKRAAAVAAVGQVTDGMVLGLGTGSTAALALRALAERMAGGLRVAGVPSSQATAALARELGIPLTTLDEHDTLDLTIDGADEVDPALRLIKGAGGALLREKVLASSSRQLAIVVDDAKLVSQLGQRSALPVEVVPFAVPAVVAVLRARGLQPQVRHQADRLAVTDNGNQIVDCRTGPIADPVALDRELLALPGVVDHGLFIGLTSVVYVGHAGGRVSVHHAGEPPAW
ncbi:MAG: ribose-5-phosphate isomerase RpiA [Chloroflexi bacterium]|nr:ribose-5-phosphate isomerase RpiA [Chloroflexota bacterium]